MKMVIAGCGFEFVSGVRMIQNGLYQMDGTPVQLKLISNEKLGVEPLDRIHIEWREKSSGDEHSEMFTASNGDWTWESDLGATADLNSLFGRQLKNACFGGLFLIVGEFILKNGDTRLMVPVSVVLVLPRKA